MLTEPPLTSNPPPLRPRAVLEILDATFRIYRENLATFLILSAAVVIPITVLSTLFNNSLVGGISPRDPAYINQVCMSSLFVLILTLAQTAILNSVSVTITSERQFGNRLTLAEAWNLASPRITKLAVGYFLFYMVVGALAFIISFVSAFCAILFVLLAFVVYLAIIVGAFIAPVITLEVGNAQNAMTRAYKLGKSRFWQLVGLGGLIILISTIIQLAFVGLISAVFLSDPRTALSTTGQWIDIAASTAVSIFVAPILPIAMTLFYFDTRIRKEGVDLSLQTYGEGARLHHVGVPANTEPFVNSQDVVNMIILIVIVVVLVLVLGVTSSAILNILAPGLGDLPTG